MHVPNIVVKMNARLVLSNTCPLVWLIRSFGWAAKLTTHDMKPKI